MLVSLPISELIGAAPAARIGAHVNTNSVHASPSPAATEQRMDGRGAARFLALPTNSRFGASDLRAGVMSCTGAPSRGISSRTAGVRSMRIPAFSSAYFSVSTMRAAKAPTNCHSQPSIDVSCVFSFRLSMSETMAWELFTDVQIVFAKGSRHEFRRFH